MSNYFRITAYHPAGDFSAIFDSHGRFEEIWQFSSFLVYKNFRILEVGETFQDGGLPKVPEDAEHIFLRACAKGRPVIRDNMVEVSGKRYFLREAREDR